METKKLYKRFKVVCLVCSKMVIKQNKQQTCSMECRSILVIKKRESIFPIGKCPACLEEKSLIHRVGEQKVCSNHCRSLYRGRITSAEKRQKAHEYYSNYVYVKPPDKRNCSVCKTKFKPVRNNHVFCSVKCRDKDCYKNTKGEKSRFKCRAKQDVLEATVLFCSICKTENKFILRPKEVGLIQKIQARFHKDHIIPQSQGGNDESKNIRMVCWFCNYTRRHMDSKFDHLIAAAGKAFWETV